MTEKRADDGYEPLTREELDEITGEPLPEHAALSLVNANLAVPVNAALGLNVLSDDSVSGAVADQGSTLEQSDDGP